jgi:HK97 gp10 family phage protein
MARVDVDIHQEAIDRLLGSGSVEDMLRDASHPVVIDARMRAPKATGQGARSIHSEMVLLRGEWESLVSWDQEHYYMYFSEEGTRYLPPRPFLVPALRAATS